MTIKVKARLCYDGVIYTTNELDIIESLERELIARKIIARDDQNSDKKKIKASINTIKGEYIKNEAIKLSIFVSPKDIKDEINNYCIKPYCINPYQIPYIWNYSSTTNTQPLIPRVYYLNFFTKAHVIPDVWRYKIEVRNGRVQAIQHPENKFEGSNFNDHPATDSCENNIVLILESPHKDEYSHNRINHVLSKKSPAQGSTGNNIEKYIGVVLGNIINLNDDAEYNLIISNPIPYMCSLGIFTDSLNNTIRDNVWKEIWNIQNNNNEFVIQKEFITRFNNYNPKYVINCCTEELTCFVTALLIKNGVSIIYKTYHPSIQWSTCKGDVPINIVRV